MSPQNKAIELASQLGLSGFPIDPAEAARELGIEVQFVTFAEEKLRREVSGAYLIDDDDRRFIYINEDEAPKRQTVTIAHELGHHIMHPNYVKSQEYQVMLRYANPQGIPEFIRQKEIEADEFARHFLVPLTALERYRGLASTKQLSDMFVVPEHIIDAQLAVLPQK